MKEVIRRNEIESWRRNESLKDENKDGKGRARQTNEPIWRHRNEETLKQLNEGLDTGLIKRGLIKGNWGI